MIVIDIGCAKYGGDYSIERLIEEFSPDLLIGLDPHPSVPNDVYLVGATMVVTMNAAGWVEDGEVRYAEDGINSWVTDLVEKPKVPCVDVARLCSGLDGAILKIDAEGSEYDILPHLIDKGVDRELRLAWVEWHKPDRGRAQIERSIRCDLHEWRW